MVHGLISFYSYNFLISTKGSRNSACSQFRDVNAR